jgi:phosphopantetheinyl transferase (holo-ACP synthase)
MKTNKKIYIENTRVYFEFCENVNFFSTNFLSEEEQCVWNDDKKQRRNGTDWLAGRLACKQALALWAKDELDLPLHLNKFSITNDSKGAPKVNLAFGNDSPKISLAHKDGKGFAVAAGNCNVIGCDMEIIKYRPIDCIYYFSTKSEYMLWENETLQNNVVSLLWTAKESVVKCLRPLLYPNDLLLDKIKLVPFLKNSFSFHYNNICGKGLWWEQENYFFAISIVVPQLTGCYAKLK